ncbi:MAG: beta-ketoacyl-[acyl-carrier-protein] synthase family protein [Bacteroidota bacterium]
MNERRVVITGMGVVAPNAIGLAAFSEALKTGKSGISHQAELERLKFACQVAGSPLLRPGMLEPYLPEVVRRSLKSTGVMYAVMAGVDAWQDADLAMPDPEQTEPDWDSGCIFGSGMTGAEPLRFGIDLVDAGKVRRIGGRLIEQGMASGPSAFLGGLLALGNQVSSNAAACATGTEAVLQGYHRIKFGLAERMLVGSCDSGGPYVWGGFDSLRVLSRKYNDAPEKASRPLSASAAGFVPGAGAGALVLETLKSAQARGARIYAEVLGGASNAGGQRGSGSMTAPNPLGVKQCIRQALDQTGLSPNELDGISGHLTATMGDPLEVQNWVETLERSGTDFPYLQAPKSLIGHCLSAAGSIESVAVALQLHEGFFHGSINCEDLHPEIEKVVARERIPQSCIQTPDLNIIAKASFGFGDVNSIAIFKKF